MAEIKFTIPNEKFQRVVDAMKGIYQIPVDDNGDPLFTDNAWAKERVRQFIIDTVDRHEKAQAANAASDAISKDDTIAT